MGAAENPAIRLGAFSFTIFVVLGIYLPFWPLWLEARGFSADDIGILLGTNIWLRALSSPLAAEFVDRTDRRRGTVLCLAWIAVPVFALFHVSDTFLGVLCVSAGFGLAFPPLMPLTDNLAMLASERHGFRYARVRTFGSLGFLLAAMLGGAWFTGRDADQIFWSIVIALAVAGGIAFALPDIRVDHARTDPRQRSPLRTLLATPRFLTFLAAVGLVQASHAAYYGFSTLHWTGHGIDETTVGVLWAEGVVAEIALFWFASRRIQKFAPAPLLLLGATGAAARWLTIAAATSVPALALVNWLHAVSFGITHLAAIQFIQREVPPHCSATAQSLMSSVSTGLFMAPAMMVAGEVFEASGPAAFRAMVWVACAGAVCAVLLWRRKV